MKERKEMADKMLEANGIAVDPPEDELDAIRHLLRKERRRARILAVATYVFVGLFVVSLLMVGVVNHTRIGRSYENAEEVVMGALALFQGLAIVFAILAFYHSRQYKRRESDTRLVDIQVRLARVESALEHLAPKD